MSEERCKVNIKPNIKFGWKLEVTGCAEVLKKIKANQGNFSDRYLTERTEIMDK